MKQMRKGCQHLAVGFLGAVMMHPAQAQDNGGADAGLTVSPGLFFEDDETRARLGFGAEIETITRNQQFSLGFDGAFDSGYDNFEDSLRSPRLSLSYGLETRATALDAQVSYRRDRISALVVDDDLDSDFLVDGTGLRTDLNTSASLTFGRTAPFGGTFDLGYRSRNYPDADDPTLLDEQTGSAGVTLRFVIDPRITARLSGTVSETDVDDPGTDQRRTSLNAGLDLTVTPTLDLSLSLGATEVVSTSSIETDTSDGASAVLSATRALPNGTLSGRIESDVTAGGRLTTVRVDRAFEMRSGATFGIEGGIGQVDDDNLQGLVRLTWAGETQTAQYNVSLDRTLAVNNDGDSALNSVVSLSWQQQLDQVSSLRTGLSLRDTSPLDGGADTSQANLSLTWRRDLTQDWGVRTTYTHSWTQETGVENTDDFSVFVGFERDIQWRP